MTEDRRKKERRTAGKVLSKTVAMLQMLEKVSRGEDVDYSGEYAELVGVRDQMGRRREDGELGNLLCSAIEAIAGNIDNILKREKSLRQVRITKASGRPDSKVPAFTVVDGWEAARPRVGEVYKVYRDDGGVFSTSIVMEVQQDYFQTQNSLYRIEVLPS
jgi:hypothetical protein